MTSDRKASFEAFIRSEDFPCVGAKSALAKGNLTIFEAGPFDSAVMDLEISEALSKFGDELDLDSPVVQSFAVLFEGPTELPEKDFEKVLWDRLQCLHNLDVAKGEEWCDGVATDPESAHFSLSLGGHAYFVVGMHPRASRPARRFESPVLVFNAHAQFEKLRADGRYDRMKTVIRDRDRELAGDINPQLDDFGQSSEARQYSGRKIEPGWECPFEHKAPV